MTSEAQNMISLALSGAAFLVSGIALGWTIYRDVLDKGRLRIHLMIGKLIPGQPGGTPVFVSWDLHAEMVKAKETPDDAGSHQLVVTITNVGRRPIVATKLAGRRSSDEGRKEWFVFKPRVLPKTLQPGDFTMEWSDNPVMFEESVRGFYVFDSAGRGWRASRRNVREFKAQAREVMREGRKP